LNSNNKSQSEQKYLDALETNKDENPSVQLMKSFAEEIVAADFGTDLQNVISDKMNINEIIVYAVVDRTIRHDNASFTGIVVEVDVPITIIFGMKILQQKSFI
jgi:hypothetical protein|tara:strand:- start:308 stop:616 length:309 start_codon:yes stop_codon:yes gene_type:complete